MRKFLAIACLIVVTGCSSQMGAPFEPMTLDYTRLGKINLAVTRVNFFNQAPKASPDDAYVFQFYKPQIADALFRWDSDRLQAGGGQGEAALEIHEASLHRERLPLKTGISSWFTRQQSERWTAQINADVRVDGAVGNFFGTATATVTRSITLPEDASLSERENAYRGLINNLMNDFNTQMESTIREHLNAVVITMP